MSKKANHSLIGAFVLGALVLMSSALFLFGGGGLFKDRPQYVLFFGGSVKGLRVGAPVNFRGVTVGSVMDVKMLYDAGDLSVRIPVVIELYPERLTVIAAGEKADDMTKLVERGLRAQLQIQSLVTSQLLVDFDFYPDTPVRLSGVEMDMPELPTISSAIQEISDTLESLPIEDIAGKLVSTLDAIEGLMNAPEIMNALREFNSGLQDFRSLMGSPGLADSIGELNLALEELQSLIRSTGAGVADVLEHTRNTVKRADTLMATASELAGNLDAGMAELAGEASEAARSFNQLSGNIDEGASALIADLRTLSGNAEGTLREVADTLVEIKDLVDVNSRERSEFVRALGELREAARALRALAELLEQRPDVLIRGKGPAR